jgi:hypothetical protein
MTSLKRWIVPLCAGVAAVVFFEAGRWWQQQSDTEAANKSAVALAPTLPKQRNEAVPNMPATQAPALTKQQSTKIPAPMPDVPGDQHRQWTASECPLRIPMKPAT